MGENGLDWLHYLAGNFQTAPTIFSYIQDTFFLNDFIKNPQTTNAGAFLPLNISAVGSVHWVGQSPLSNNIAQHLQFFAKRQTPMISFARIARIATNNLMD